MNNKMRTQKKYMVVKPISNAMICMFSISLLLIACNSEIQLSDVEFKKKERTMNYVETFKIADCEKITLYYYEKMSDPRDGGTPKTREITDRETITKLLALINKLPDEGEKMIKMGDVAMLRVNLTLSKSETVFFTYYGKMVKAPDTAFYSNGPAEEKTLYGLLITLLNQ
jgi:hypothetical protein